MKRILIAAVVLILSAVSVYSADFSIRTESTSREIYITKIVETSESIVAGEVSAVKVSTENAEAAVSNEGLVDMSAVAMGVGIF